MRLDDWAHHRGFSAVLGLLFTHHFSLWLREEILRHHGVNRVLLRDLSFQPSTLSDTLSLLNPVEELDAVEVEKTLVYSVAAESHPGQRGIDTGHVSLELVVRRMHLEVSGVLENEVACMVDEFVLLAREQAQRGDRLQPLPLDELVQVHLLHQFVVCLHQLLPALLVLLAAIAE